MTSRSLIPIRIADRVTPAAVFAVWMANPLMVDTTGSGAGLRL